MSQLIPSLLQKNGVETARDYVARRYHRRFVGYRGRAAVVAGRAPEGRLHLITAILQHQVSLDDPTLDLDSRYAGYYPHDDYGVVYYGHHGRDMGLGVPSRPRLLARQWVTGRDALVVEGDGGFYLSDEGVNAFTEADILLRPEFRHPPVGCHRGDVEIYGPMYCRVGKQMWGPRFQYLGIVGETVEDPVALLYLDMKENVA